MKTHKINNNYIDTKSLKSKPFIVRWYKRLINNIKHIFQRINKGYSIKDTWSIRDWFLDVMPNIIMDFKNNLNSHPGDINIEQWELILQDMYNHLIGCKEDITKNKYYQEWCNMYDEFSKQYGILGQKLNKDTESIIHFPREVSSEWSEISNKFIQDEERLQKERIEHLHQFCILFEKYFWDLWD